jgi:hypothetical protein
MRTTPRTSPAAYTARAREVINAGGTQVRNTWWSQRVSWEEVCKRTRGRARYNSLRRLRARLRQREVLQLLARWGWKPGVQSLIAAHLGVHRSTVCRDLHTLPTLLRTSRFCPHAYRAVVWCSRQNFRDVCGSLSRPYRLLVTPQNCRRCLFHIECLILPLYGPEGSSS